MVVALAGKCVTGLAKGLRKKFQTYSGILMSALFGKFKEKKLNVVISLRDAVDAVFATVSFNLSYFIFLIRLKKRKKHLSNEYVKVNVLSQY